MAKSLDASRKFVLRLSQDRKVVLTEADMESLQEGCFVQSGNEIVHHQNSESADMAFQATIEIEF